MEKEEVVINLLKDKNLTLTTAESCTGGLIAATLINVSGVSQVIKESYITYSDEAKCRILGVKKETIEQNTVVSKEVAAEMAIGGQKKASSDVCISITGVAGPTSEEGKPVGLIYLGCAYKNKVEVKELFLRGTRQEIRRKCVDEAFDFIISMVMDVKE